MQRQQTNTHLLLRSQSFAPDPQDTYCIRERRQCSLVVTPGTGDKKKKNCRKRWRERDPLYMRHRDNESKEKEGGRGTAGRSRQGVDKDHRRENMQT